MLWVNGVMLSPVKSISYKIQCQCSNRNIITRVFVSSKKEAFIRAQKEEIEKYRAVFVSKEKKVM